MINYYLLTKPGIIFGNLITVAAGFLLASRGTIDLRLFLAALLGMAFIMASSCVFNNDINAENDKKMERTKNRALVTGLISRENALAFAVLLLIIGCYILFRYTNALTMCVAGAGFFVYVFLYSFWKCRTIYGTAIGSIAGAIPPVVGYTAVSNHLDLGALILFLIMVLWQMPHFFSIAIYHLDDYTKAEIPVLPIAKGLYRAKIHMVIYIVGFLAAASLLTLFGFTGNIYLGLTWLVGMSWLVLCLKGFKLESTHDNYLWARSMFRVSLVMIMTMCLVIPLDLQY
jgi:protoheme IX farnesyltransferase